MCVCACLFVSLREEEKGFMVEFVMCGGVNEIPIVPGQDERKGKNLLILINTCHCGVFRTR